MLPAVQSTGTLTLAIHCGISDSFSHFLSFPSLSLTPCYPISYCLNYNHFFPFLLLSPNSSERFPFELLHQQRIAFHVTVRAHLHIGSA